MLLDVKKCMNFVIDKPFQLNFLNAFSDIVTNDCFHLNF